MELCKLPLRAVTPADTSAIQAFIAAIYADYGFVLDYENLDRHLLDPGPYFRASGGEMWVLDADDGIVATVAVSLHPDDSAELRTLYVRRDARRQGLGARLIGWVERYARQAGKTRVVLWSDTHFTDAHRLYLRLGYRQVGRRELHDINDTRELGFGRDLSD